MDDGRLIFEESVTPEIKRKLHDYIRKCLKDELYVKFNGTEAQKEIKSQKSDEEPVQK